MKTCSFCGVTKPINDFHKHSKAPDGRQRMCKPCHLALNRATARRNPTRRREILGRQYQEETRQGRRETKKSPQFKKNASNAVYRAIKRGDLVRPRSCPICSATKHPIYAHHEDYGQPLVVTWMCAPCLGFSLASQREGARDAL